ncbi:PLP-dependent transferase [Rhizoclosmatium globosum]|uniref:PLP-dependent transferase n=1 Tax=Rhizoclosmatium globosum TaxID=329046 RepID=A0A1Y2BX86_9FUNG|nr:PLP-dependent transferase [Rhizoclosmatium globosum]|eukprot:ORY39380.1 PLP-dependent transferase [Rhizoclosmatium globosum]
MLSQRANRNLEISSSNMLFVGMKAASSNAYDRDSNMSGIINMGVAENALMSSEVISQVHLDVRASDLGYGSFRGSSRLRFEVASLMNRRHGLGATRLELSANHVAIGNGAGSVVASVAHILADENDAILVPAPVYGAFRSDLLANAGVTAVFVNAKDSLPNPTGKVVPLSLLKEWIEWAHARNLHCIVDEVYIICIRSTMDVDPLRTHIIWSFSKDFCLNGIRAGALISKNQQVLDAYNELAYFHGIPSIDRFTKTNYERLRDSFELSGSLILFHKFLDGGLYIAPSEAFFCDPAGPDASRFRINVPLGLDRMMKVLDQIID